jgi:hypothetical protein
MAIDPNISLRVEPLKLESPANMLSQIAQLRASQQQEQFNAMRIAQAQREQADAERFNALMARGGAMPQELIQFTQGRDVLKTMGDLGLRERQQQQAAAQTRKSEFELTTAQTGVIRQALRSLSSLPNEALTRTNIAQRLSALAQQGVPASLIDATIAQLSDNPVENRLEIDTALQADMTGSQQSEATKPMPQAVNISGKVVQIDMNPRSPTFSQPMMITPEAPYTLSAGQQRMQGGQVIASAPFAPRPETTTPTPPAPSITEIQDPTNPAQVIRIDARTYQGGGVGSPGVIGVSKPAVEGPPPTPPAPSITEIQDPTNSAQTLRINAREYAGGGLGSPGVLGVSRPAVEGLSPRDLQKREAAYPRATLSVKTIEANTDSLIKDLQALREHPGLSGITGAIESRLPSFGPATTAAEALFDKIQARGTFATLQAMREASKTGGALGNVSNFEVKKLESAFAGLDRRQGTQSFQQVIDAAIAELEGTKTRIREAYDEEYSYRQPGPAQGGGSWSVVR